MWLAVLCVCRRVGGLLLVVFGVFVVVGVAGCGGSGGGGARRAASTGGGVSGVVGDRGRVVARVGGAVVTAGVVDRWLGIEERRENLAPPEFASCVTRLRAAGSVPGSPSAAAGVGRLSVAQLRGECAASVAQLREEALKRYILGGWVFGAARELGVDISGKAFDRRFAAVVKSAFRTQARYRAYLASVGNTEADERFQVRRSLDTEAIRAAILRRVGPITPARVREYYEHHKSHYFFQETRNLQIAAVQTRAQALGVRRKIVSGESFARVVAGLHFPQAILSSHGLVEGLPRGYYKEPSLDDAIFTARPGVLIGPIKTVIGYFVIRLLKVNAAYREPFAKVAPTIKRTLPELLDSQALEGYIARWRAKWTARTDCAPGYVIRKCRQYKTSPGERLEPPNVFD
jgi:parvulin-like peptidyl-prolyl isomerase